MPAVEARPGVSSMSLALKGSIPVLFNRNIMLAICVI